MRQTVLGVPVDNLSVDESLDRIGSFIADGRPHQHVVINVDKIVKASRDPQLLQIISRCDLINADGMPVVWASRLLGQPLKERVTGIDLFFALLARAARSGWRVYFLGAQRPVVEAVVVQARSSHPTLQVVGHHDGYWPADQDAAVAAAIAQARPDILFVAISSPRKEQFLATHQALMRVPFAMGVGGTFDVMVGKARRAPRWMQRTGLEWLFRFLQEPRRMFRRYFIDSLPFFGLLLRAMFSRRVFAR